MKEIDNLKKENIKKKIPNILSTTRLIMSPFIPFVFASGNIAALIYALIGNATDAADGFLARRWHVQSRYGKIIDPISDKLFNLLALGFAGFMINPLLLGIFACETTVAAITTSHAIHNIKNKKVDTKKMGVFDKLELLLQAFDELKVSRVGRKKAVFMVGTFLTSLLIPTVPALNALFLTLAGVTVTLEIPTISKYALEYRKDLGNISDKGNKMLNKLDNLDKWVDKITDKTINGIKKVISIPKKVFSKSKSNNEIIQDQSIPEMVKPENSDIKETEKISTIKNVSQGNPNSYSQNMMLNYPTNNDETYDISNDIGYARTKNITHR